MISGRVEKFHPVFMMAISSMTGPALPILLADDRILAIDKPSGLLAIPDGYHPGYAHVRMLLEPLYGRLWVVHRLDKETSGVFLLARDTEAHRELNAQFAYRKVKKEYRLIAAGVHQSDQWEVALPLKVNGDRAHRTVVDLKHGKPATTRFHVIHRFSGGYCLLAAYPASGYTHQIRAHLAACGLSIAGDPLYQPRVHPAMVAQILVSFSDEVKTANRLMLHACHIEFLHPGLKQPVSIASPLPDDFNIFLREVSEPL